VRAFSLRPGIFDFDFDLIFLINSPHAGQMRTPLRAAIAVALIITLFLVKHHLDSILRWRDDEIILGDAYIELVSAHAATPASHTQTRRKWYPTARPTAQVIANPEPERIPVDVPGAEWAGELFFNAREAPNFHDSMKGLIDNVQLLAPVEQGDATAPSSTAPSRPKVTPKSDRVIIVGKMSYEDTNWLEDHLPEYVLINRPLIILKLGQF
jgi:hypothetical protein